MICCCVSKRIILNFCGTKGNKTNTDWEEEVMLSVTAHQTTSTTSQCTNITSQSTSSTSKSIKFHNTAHKLHIIIHEVPHHNLHHSTFNSTSCTSQSIKFHSPQVHNPWHSKSYCTASHHNPQTPHHNPQNSTTLSTSPTSQSIKLHFTARTTAYKHGCHGLHSTAKHTLTSTFSHPATDWICLCSISHMLTNFQRLPHKQFTTKSLLSSSFVPEVTKPLFEYQVWNTSLVLHGLI